MFGLGYYFTYSMCIERALMLSINTLVYPAYHLPEKERP